jgi:hypothetical protein
VTCNDALQITNYNCRIKQTTALAVRIASWLRDEEATATIGAPAGVAGAVWRGMATGISASPPTARCH